MRMFSGWLVVFSAVFALACGGGDNDGIAAAGGEEAGSGAGAGSGGTGGGGAGVGGVIDTARACEDLAEAEIFGENEAVERCWNIRVNMDFAHFRNMHR